MRMKKLTLDINERQEQEDYQGTAEPKLWLLFSSFGILSLNQKKKKEK